MQADKLALLKQHLSDNYVAHLKPLLQPSGVADQNEAKNLSRSLSAFALRSSLGISIEDACTAVVDDFGDLGIDAIYFDAATLTLHLIQSKLKTSEEFSQDEANAFCQGVRKLVVSDYNGFNQNVLDRQVEIDAALDECERIQLMVAHTGEALGQYPSNALHDLIAEDPGGEDRIEDHVLDYCAAQLESALSASQAYTRINCNLKLSDWSKLTGSREAVVGMVKLADLVRLHREYGPALYARNIRASLGHRTPVNQAIAKSLDENPNDFEFFNNGVTALCKKVSSGKVKRPTKTFKIERLSIVNGAQTVASAARKLGSSSDGDAEDARVLLTIIAADGDRAFGKDVTRYRNFQNAVEESNFVALDDQQERLRRELAVLGYRYAYQAEAYDLADPSIITAQEAVFALAMTLPDPNLPTMAKRNAASLQRVGDYPYPEIFTNDRAGTELRNAVLVFRYALRRVEEESESATDGPFEGPAYRQGAYVIAFILAKRLRDAINGIEPIDPAKLALEVGPTFDVLRQEFWDRVKPIVTGGRAPLPLFKTQADVRPLIQELMKFNFGLGASPAVTALEGLDLEDDKPYQLRLFRYLSNHAPQIANVT